MIQFVAFFHQAGPQTMHPIIHSCLYTYAETPFSTTTSVITDTTYTTQSKSESTTNVTGGVMPSPIQAGKTIVTLSVALGLVMIGTL